jgi:hypothetical protein
MDYDLHMKDVIETTSKMSPNELKEYLNYAILTNIENNNLHGQFYKKSPEIKKLLEDNKSYLVKYTEDELKQIQSQDFINKEKVGNVDGTKLLEETKQFQKTQIEALTNKLNYLNSLT